MISTVSVKQPGHPFRFHHTCFRCKTGWFSDSEAEVCACGNSTAPLATEINEMADEVRTFDRGKYTLVIEITNGIHKQYQIPKKDGKVLSVSKLQKAKNLAVATARHIAAGRPKATQEQVAERFEICTVCEYLIKDKMECGKCGCGIKSVVGPMSKLAWADSKCPDDRWGRIQT